MAAQIVIALTSLFFLFAWFIVLLTNVLKVVRITKLEGDEKPENRGWIVWGLSIASLFSGCCLALIAWVVIEWVLEPIDPFKDSLGTIQLHEKARSNISFVIVSNVIVVLVIGIAQAIAAG